MTFIKMVSSIIFKSIWKVKSDKVKRGIMIQDYCKGGLKMVEMCYFNKAPFFFCIKQYIFGTQAEWKAPTEYVLDKTNLKFYLQSNFDISERCP